MHALIIEDEPPIGMAIQDVLRDEGYSSFDFAASADEAVAAATRRCPDLITADVQLAPGSGVDAVLSICSRAAVPVIFVTSTGAEVQGRCPQHVIVAKPFRPSQLADAVRRVAGNASPA
jgi:DNA-binding response OmpR family regulator